MDNENLEYIVPPRLNKRYLFYGYTLPELIIGLGCLIIGIVASQFYLLPTSAIILVSSIRNPATERNIRDRMKLLYRYYGRPQSYTLKECENENNQLN